MERFMNGVALCVELNSQHVQKPWLMAEMIHFLEMQMRSSVWKESRCPCYRRVSVLLMANPLWFTRQSLCIHPERDPHWGLLPKQCETPYFSVDRSLLVWSPDGSSNERSHPSHVKAAYPGKRTPGCLKARKLGQFFQTLEFVNCSTLTQR